MKTTILKILFLVFISCSSKPDQKVGEVEVYVDSAGLRIEEVEKSSAKSDLEFVEAPLEPVDAHSLLEHVHLAINPNFENWVLFENGTYIIFDDLNGISDVQQEAIRLMKEYGPVSPGGPSGDFGVTHLNKTEGWVVSGHGYGMYTYVHPSELNQSAPDDSAIGLFGRSKRARDAKNLKIIHVNLVNK